VSGRDDPGGWLFRSDTLARLSPAGVAALRSAGVTTVIDLRDAAALERLRSRLVRTRR
jgi:hypothetical protein